MLRFSCSELVLDRLDPYVSQHFSARGDSNVGFEALYNRVVTRLAMCIRLLAE